jgi:hypothetical protein
MLSSGHRNAVPITSIERCITVLTRRAENGVPSIQLSGGDTVIAREFAAVISRYSLDNLCAFARQASLRWDLRRRGCGRLARGCCSCTGHANLYKQVPLVVWKWGRKLCEATYAVIVSGKELSIAILSSRAQDRIPSIELSGGDALVACKLAAVVAGSCFCILVAVGYHSRLRRNARSAQ